MATDLERTIYEVIAYFTFFEYPVTSFEVFKWQMRPERPYSLGEIELSLASSPWLTERITTKDGFFCLRLGGQLREQVARRHERYQNAIVKYRKLFRVVRYLRRLPGVAGVAICNSLAFHHTRPESDIDLFVITDAGQVWSTRLLAVAPLIALRQRPGEAKHNPVDLSFFASWPALDLSSLRLAGADPYLSAWIRSLVPVYERDASVFATFWRKNAWTEALLPQARLARRIQRERSLAGLKIKLPLRESWAKWLQQKKFPSDIRAQANQSTNVIVNDDMLKFHKNDRREAVAKSLQDKMKICESA